MEEVALDVGWPLVQREFKRLVLIIDYGAMDDFKNDDYMLLYSTVYGMCCQRNGSEFVYAGYKSMLEDYLRYQVLPTLHQKKDAHLLEELVKRWSNYLLLVKRLKFFCYLDYHYTWRHAVPKVRDAALECFRVLVYDVVESRAKHALQTYVNRDCDWQASDQALLTKALEFFMIIDNKDVEFVRKIRSAKDVKELSERMASL